MLVNIPPQVKIHETHQRIFVHIPHRLEQKRPGSG